MNVAKKYFPSIGSMNNNYLVFIVLLMLKTFSKFKTFWGESVMEDEAFKFVNFYFMSLLSSQFEMLFVPSFSFG